MEAEGQLELLDPVPVILAMVESEGLTTAVIDKAVTEMYAARRRYDDAKKISNEFDAKHKSLKAVVVKLLTDANKDRYSENGVGSVSRVEKLRVTTPKSLEDKAALFKYLKDTLGADGFLTYASVNSASLTNYTMIHTQSAKTNQISR